MAGEYGLNAQQIVSYHDISKARATRAAPAAHGPVMVNIGLRYCVQACGMRTGEPVCGPHEGSFPQHGAELRHSCNRFRRLLNQGQRGAGTEESFWLASGTSRVLGRTYGRGAPKGVRGQV